MQSHYIKVPQGDIFIEQTKKIKAERKKTVLIGKESIF